MEASIHPMSNPVLLKPSHSLHSSCKKGMRFFFQSSFVASCACKGLYLRCSPNRLAIWHFTNNFVSNSILGISRESGEFWRLLVSKKEFGGSLYDQKLNNRNKYSRCIAVRSELAETGAPGAAYPFSGSYEKTSAGPKNQSNIYAVTALTAVFLFVLMILTHPFVLLLDQSGRQFHHIIAKFWAILTITAFYKVKFEGLENLPAPDTPAMYVSNHQSFLDIYTLLMLGRSFKFISKTAIFLFPVVGWAMFLMGVIPLKRLDSKSQLVFFCVCVYSVCLEQIMLLKNCMKECLKRCMDLVKKGASVFFFPEGTRSRDGKLGAFKKGAFSVAAKTRVPVVPITILGTGKIMPAGMEGLLKTGSLKVVIHEPIKGTNADILCNEARSMISEVLNH